MRNTLVPSAILAVAVTVAGCAKDPAAEATAASVREVEPSTTAAEAAPAPADTPSVGETLRFSGATSKIEWTGSKVTGSHDGGFRDFEGTITLDDDDVTASSVHVTIRTGSLFSDTDKLTRHLTTNDFFEVERFPTAEFTSTRIVAGAEGDATHTVTGNLTLHGVTKQVTFPATLTVDAGEAAARAEFSINRKDWGLDYPGMPDDLIRDGVVIRLELRAPRHAES